MKKTICILFFICAAVCSLEVKAQYLNATDYAAAEKVLPCPPDTSGQRYMGDWLMYNWGKTQRTGTRGAEANADATVSGVNLCKVFSPAFGYTLSVSKTPQIYKLLNTVRNDVNLATESVKAKYNRKRPFVQLNENSMIPSNEASARNTSSYVSEHAAIGWATALILAEINIARQDTILSRGYQFGQSRVITGYHYQSDVEGGRVVGMMAVARLHANAAFMEQLELAKAEYASLVGVSSPSYMPRATGEYYNLQGQKVDEKTLEDGQIYIHDGQKLRK